MCCTRLAENTGRKKIPKNRHLGTTGQLCSAISSQLRHISTIGKNVKQQYLFHMSQNMVNFGPLTGEICWRVWGTPANFNWFRLLASLLHWRRSTGGQQKSAGCLAVSWAGTQYIHSWGFLSANGILPAAKFTLRPSLAFSYIGSVTARHSSSGRQPNFVASFKEWNYGTFADGATYIRLGSHHVGHRPTF